jgi:hypothetical protein
MPERYRIQHIGQRIRFTDRGRARPMGSASGLFLLRKDGSERPVCDFPFWTHPIS